MVELGKGFVLFGFDFLEKKVRSIQPYTGGIFEFELGISLQTKNNSTNQSEIQTLKIEGITFQLTSNCNDLINVEGKKTGVFFKALFFSYDKNTKKLVPYTQLFDFKNYVVNTVNQ